MWGVFSHIGNTVLALGGLCIAIFAVFATLCALTRLWLNFEAFVAGKFREESGCDWTYGDHPSLPDNLKVPSVFHNGTNTTRRRNDHVSR
jgi:hypothetical protein